MALLTLFASLLATACATPLLPRAPNATSLSGVYSFKNVPVTKDIQYIPCFGNFTCTNLEVPLDYDDASAGTTNIAFVKHTATKQPAKGDIIFNPGGPGGSAVDFMVGGALFVLPRLLGDEWNIVGMDPRGVNNSGPNLDCFDGSPSVRDYYDTTYVFDVDARSDASIRKYFANAGGFGTWCSRTLNDSAKYANTPATARDMLQYAELLAQSQGKKKEDAKVDYYGVSYGSALGNTFAQLYPERVGKFVIDGNVDVADYYQGSWSQNLLQTDQAVGAFFELCYKAGPKCEFFRNDTSADSIKQRVDTILKDMEERPITVTNPDYVQFPTVVTHMDLRYQILLAMYDSIALWPIGAKVLAQLEKRDGSLLALLNGRGAVLPGPEPKDYSSVQPKLLIACNDNNGRYNVSSLETLNELYATNRALSKYVGEVWTQVIVPQCRNLRFSPPKNQQFGELKKVKTSTPILFVNNKIDPVTSSYVKMAAYYEDAGIMLQDAVGHGLILAASKCSTGYVTKYLATGELPPPGTLCPIDEAPFESSEAPEKRGLVSRRLHHL